MKSVRIFCENTQTHYTCQPGTTLYELASRMHLRMTSDILAAWVNNQLKDLSYEIYVEQTVRFIDIAHPDGIRTYQRSLSFLCQKAVRDVLPDYRLAIKHPISRGLYGEITCNGQPADKPLLKKVNARMRELVQMNIPFVRVRKETDEAIRLFDRNGQHEKALLQKTRGRFYTTIYYLDDYPDCFYGPLVYSTGYLTVFELCRYHDGILLRMPKADKPRRLESKPKQAKLFRIFQQHKDWNRILGATNIGSLNELIQGNQIRPLILVAEALQEREYVSLAKHIQQRHDRIKLALLAGPSSSGKTTTAKRLGIQIKLAGLNPVAIELDNYFVDREKTPRDANGRYDFDSIDALDLDLLNTHLRALLRGQTITPPYFNFISGRRRPSGHELRIRPHDLLILEGIHALNPKLTEGVDRANKFQIYASALTSIAMDENNRISTTDNRLIRRIVRDARTRGYSAAQTIAQWSSVRRGEDRYIFPFQEQADIMFNSALLYELAVLRRYAAPLLHRILPVDPSYAEALRLLKFLSYFEMIAPDDESTIPSTSVLREFIGGSCFDY
ncbi:MAG: nucleoside kinase [Prevotellaceae bacterium]|jgi:uridine kinase|nr:nucleoside kinase [Prevotellaceae bacterium]